MKENIVPISLGYIIDVDMDDNEQNIFYFANMDYTDVMEMYMSFIEEDWEEEVQISQAYEYADLPPEDWWYDMPRKQILHQIANRYIMGALNDIPFYNP